MEKQNRKMRLPDEEKDNCEKEETRSLNPSHDVHENTDVPTSKCYDVKRKCTAAAHNDVTDLSVITLSGEDSKCRENSK